MSRGARWSILVTAALLASSVVGALVLAGRASNDAEPPASPTVDVEDPCEGSPEARWDRLRALGGRPLDQAKTAYALYKCAWREERKLEALLYLELGLEAATLAPSEKYQLAILSGYFRIMEAFGDLPGMEAALGRAVLVRDALGPRGEIAVEMNLGIVNRMDDELDRASHRFRRAAELARSEESQFGFYDALHNLAETELELGRIDEARPIVERVLAFEGRGDDPRFPSKLELETRWRQALGDHEGAIAAAREALAGDPNYDHGWELETRLGVSSLALGRTHEAEAVFEAAVSRIERRRRRYEINRFKASHLARAREPFERLFRLRLAQSPEAAAEVVERAKGRVFLEAFGRSETRLVPDEGEALDRARRRVREMAALAPLLHHAPATLPRPWPEVWEGAKPHHLLMWFESVGTLYALYLSGGRLEVDALGSSRAIRRELVRLVAEPTNEALAERLGQRLLPRELSLDRPLVLIPDGPLAPVPIGLLRRGGRPLAALVPLTYAPNLSSLSLLESGPAVASGRAHVFAAGLDLPEARIEAEEVAERLGGRLFSPAGQEQLLGAKEAGVIHIASHAGLDRTGGSWIGLSDGAVFASQILRAQLRPRLVVLASCSSASRFGPDLWGSVGAAFLAAGAESVIGSLWSIEDTHARELVRRFYDSGGAEDPIVALHRARASLIEEGAHPNAWAPFVHLGAP